MTLDLIFKKQKANKDPIINVIRQMQFIKVLFVIILIFALIMIPGDLDPATLRNNDYVNSVWEQMESFEPKELKQKFDAFKDHISSQQQTYIQYLDYFKELQTQLRQTNAIHVSLKEFKNNADISEKILMIKHLSRYTLQKPDGKFNKESQHPTFYPMSKDEYDIAVSHYFGKSEAYVAQVLKKTVVEVNIEGKRKVLHLVNFKDEDMKKVVDWINVDYELNYKYGWQDEIMKEQQDKQNKQNKEDKQKEAS